MTNSHFFCKYKMLKELYQNKEMQNSMELTFSEKLTCLIAAIINSINRVHTILAWSEICVMCLGSNNTTHSCDT